MWGVPVRLKPFLLSLSSHSSLKLSLTHPSGSLSQIPSHSTALSFFDGYRSEMVPANLIQAQRDYFGGESPPSHFRRNKDASLISSIRSSFSFSPHLQGSSRKGERSTESWRGYPRQLDRSRWKHVRFTFTLSPASLTCAAPSRLTFSLPADLSLLPFVVLRSAPLRPTTLEIVSMSSASLRSTLSSSFFLLAC